MVSKKEHFGVFRADNNPAKREVNQRNKVPDLEVLEAKFESISSLITLYHEANSCQPNDMAG